MATIVPNNFLPDRLDCVYTKCYCEENVWKLCDFIKGRTPDVLSNCFCVFISNKKRQIPLWSQKHSKRDDKLVLWDYHVIFVFKDNHKVLVYDLDTTLTFPCSSEHYIISAIRSEENLNEDFRRLFRVISAETFLKTFASDRCHMINMKDGNYLSPPPVYPPIKTAESTNNLEDFICMDEDVGVGTVMNYQQFCDKFLRV
ncbi:protein N-terminal glutamine amidohydrolase [Patella vulgata]|uniref:protein N-terminal glutamine amidohydrolase n=1 Tax=Patella vulgata TaxID=6465 RepID=UPI00217F67FB|nr:protein N-terminal glutamine amidohydrolase [Patella vulgata]